MMKKTFKDSKLVLVFNGAQVLIGILRSLNTTAEYSGGNLQSISFACTGLYISTGGYYYRYANENVEVSLEDIGALQLKEFDKLCGETNRSYRSVRDMAHRRKAHHSRNKRRRNDED